MRREPTILPTSPAGRRRRARTDRLCAVTDTKTELRSYLQSARDALLWKLDGLSEYDVRRPLTPTGTNLLGLVKHASYVESGYLADSFGRPSGLDLPWLGGSEPSSDLWVAADQPRESVIDGYRQAWSLADATLDELPLDTVGAVPWWPADDNALTLHHALVRVVSDTQRHAGHADIVRELVDGAVGMNEDNASLPTDDPTWWRAHRQRVEDAARAAETSFAR
jgi:Protein of unknown function (DUF664)